MNEPVNTVEKPRKFTLAERTIIMGVAHDMHSLRARAGMTTRAVADGLGWGSGGFAIVARYEHGAPKEEDDDAGVRMITVRRYFEIMKFYFAALPDGVKDSHPAAKLMDERYNAVVERLSKKTDMTIFEFVVFVQAMWSVGSIKDDDPHMRFVNYLQIKGVSA
jgi:hypothetical protein